MSQLLDLPESIKASDENALAPKITHTMWLQRGSKKVTESSNQSLSSGNMFGINEYKENDPP
jgi:hypothetical protein